MYCEYIIHYSFSFNRLQSKNDFQKQSEPARTTAHSICTLFCCGNVPFQCVGCTPVTSGPFLSQKRRNVRLQPPLLPLIEELAKRPLTWGVITVLCAEPRRAAAPFAKGVVCRKWINSLWPVVLDTDWKRPGTELCREAQIKAYRNDPALRHQT